MVKPLYVRVRQILKSLGEVAGKPTEAGEKQLKDIVLTNKRVKDIHDMLCHAAQVARERGVPLDKAYEYVYTCTAAVVTAVTALVGQRGLAY